MLVLVCVFSLSIILLLSLACLWQARRFSQGEREWRERERLLVDRLLRQAKVEPLAARHEIENVVKWPDPELPPLSIEAQLLREDAIKEEIEIRYPDMVPLASWQVRDQHGEIWREFERRYEEAHTPLRA